MSKPELLYGERAQADFPQPGNALTFSDRNAVELADVEIFYSLFELPMGVAIARLPESLHPSIPAVMATNFWHAPSSPFGEFHLAYVALACRTGIKPRHLIVGSWCDNPAAAQFFRERYGFDCQAAAIQCRETFERVIGRIVVDDATILETVGTEFVPIVSGGGSVKYSPPLNLAMIDGQAMLAQFEGAYTFKRVLRGNAINQIYRASALGDDAIKPTSPIAGTLAVCDVHLLPVRFQVDLAIPAEAGGASKIGVK